MDGQLSSGAPRTWHRKDPGQGTAPVGLDAYVSPNFFEAEREKIFRAGWINMGRVEEMPEPGDYLVRDLRVAHTSILIVRGKDGQIRGFHNMCAHRGNPVAWHERWKCVLAPDEITDWIFSCVNASSISVSLMPHLPNSWAKTCPAFCGSG